MSTHSNIEEEKMISHGSILYDPNMICDSTMEMDSPTKLNLEEVISK